MDDQWSYKNEFTVAENVMLSFSMSSMLARASMNIAVDLDETTEINYFWPESVCLFQQREQHV